MKKKFGLFSKTSNELVNQVETETESEATSFFAKVKNLKIKDLVSIFSIKEVKPKSDK